MTAPNRATADTADRCVVCHLSATRHGGLCCAHRYDEQPRCSECPPHATAATDEAWSRHRVGPHGCCCECDQLWPCDIAKAWRHGYQWAQVERSLGALREQLGASDGT